ncbi:MAG: RidA family protein [Acidobacteria bacterium]|nr:RidA family protein [Acidobacteriota bacterium]
MQTERMQRSGWKRLGVIAAVLAAGGYALAQGGAAQKAQAAPEKQFLQPAGMHRPTAYTHVVTSRGGKLVFIAGQVAFNEKGEIVGKGDLRAQATQVFENLKTALAAAGGTWNDVVKINWYIAGYNAEMLPMLREVRGKYTSAANPPASTLVGVAALANPDILLEVEAIAVVR